jgi:hypothetical protein
MHPSTLPQWAIASSNVGTACFSTTPNALETLFKPNDQKLGIYSEIIMLIGYAVMILILAEEFQPRVKDQCQDER